MNKNEYLRKYDQHLRLKKFSISTYKVYTGILTRFLNRIKCDAAEATENDLKEYLLQYHNENTAAQIHGCLLNFYKCILNQPEKVKYIPFPKKAKPLPSILNIDEVQKIISCIENTKHRAIIQLIYSCALRISEAVNLKIADIDGKTQVIHLKAAKGKKDRAVYLPEDTLTMLRNYFSEYRPKIYLFNGQFSERYTERSIQQVFSEACKHAQIRKHATVHTLRHSRATHMVDNGVPLNYVQELLGHSDIRTTLIYTHTSISSMKNIFARADLSIKQQLSLGPIYPALAQR